MFEEMMIEGMRKEIVKRFGLESEDSIYFCTMAEGFENGVLDYSFVMQVYLRMVCR